MKVVEKRKNIDEKVVEKRKNMNILTY